METEERTGTVFTTAGIKGLQLLIIPPQNGFLSHKCVSLLGKCKSESTAKHLDTQYLDI